MEAQMPKISFTSYVKSFFVISFLAILVALLFFVLLSGTPEATAVVIAEGETLVVTSDESVEIVMYTRYGESTTKLLKDGQVIGETHKTLAPRSYEYAGILEPGEYSIIGETVIVDAGKPNIVSDLSSTKKNYFPTIMLIILLVFLFFYLAAAIEETSNQRRLQEQHSH